MTDGARIHWNAVGRALAESVLVFGWCTGVLLLTDRVVIRFLLAGVSLAILLAALVLWRLRGVPSAGGLTLMWIAMASSIAAIGMGSEPLGWLAVGAITTAACAFVALRGGAPPAWQKRRNRWAFATLLAVAGALIAAGLVVSPKVPLAPGRISVAMVVPQDPGVVVPQNPSVVLACPEGTVRVPAGTFQMGSPAGLRNADEHPQHLVTVATFCMDRTEVTVRAYGQCAEAGRCVTAPTTVYYPYYAAAEVRLWSQFCNGNRADRQDHPINCVDWTQASVFCQWAGGRLPTEAEWEYAARGSGGRAYPWGDESPDATRLNACGSECVAWAQSQHRTLHGMYPGNDGWPHTAPVGRFPAGNTPLGLEDMAGNVWEWTADWYGPYSDSGAHPVGGTNRVDRGGGWDNTDISKTRAAFRGVYDPLWRGSALGFRCVRGRPR